MKKIWIILVSLLFALLVGLLVMPGGDRPDGGVASGAGTRPTVEAGQPIRLGLVPDQNIFTVRKRSRVLADYLQSKLGRPVELVTTRSYGGILRDFQENQVDAAFLGSLVTVLAVDRLGAKVMLKTELPSGVSTYHGVVCVLEDSPIHSVAELAGKKLAVVRTTTGGNLFPLYSLAENGILGGVQRPVLMWLGTHDDAIKALIRGEVDAAGVKDLRLQAILAANPTLKIRVLAQSGAVPENSLVVRGDLADTLGKQMADVLLKMDKDPAGQVVLKEYGAQRFLPCSIEQFGTIYQIVEKLGPAWSQLDIDGPAPRPLNEVK